MTIETGREYKDCGPQAAADLVQSALECGADNVVVGAGRQGNIAGRTSALALTDLVGATRPRERWETVDRDKTDVRAIQEMPLDSVSMQRAEVGNHHR